MTKQSDWHMWHSNFLDVLKTAGLWKPGRRQDIVGGFPCLRCKKCFKSEQAWSVHAFYSFTDDVLLQDAMLTERSVLSVWKSTRIILDWWNHLRHSTRCMRELQRRGLVTAPEPSVGRCIWKQYSSYPKKYPGSTRRMWPRGGDPHSTRPWRSLEPSWGELHRECVGRAWTSARRATHCSCIGQHDLAMPYRTLSYDRVDIRNFTFQDGSGLHTDVGCGRPGWEREVRCDHGSNGYHWARMALAVAIWTSTRCDWSRQHWWWDDWCHQRSGEAGGGSTVSTTCGETVCIQATCFLAFVLRPS